MGIESYISPSLIQQNTLPGVQKKKTAVESALDILGSKGGQTAVAGAGAALQAYGQHQDSEANRQQSAGQFRASTLSNQLNSDRDLQLAQAKGAADASPIGESQLFAQRNALLLPMLQGARNFSVTPGDPRVAAAMGQMSGGMRLPEGGLDPAMLERMFGDASTLESIKNRQQAVGQINPNMVTQDLGSMFGQAGSDASGQIAQANSAMAAQQQADTARQRELIMRAIDEDIKGEKQKKSGNIFGKILKGVGSAAGFIPGVGQIVAPIATGLGGLVNGDGVKSSLINAGMSAVPGLAAAGKLGGTAAKFAKNPIGRAIMGGL